MNDYDDEDNRFNESEDTDPVIRELRTEVVRLESQLDQLLASVRERAEEAAVIQAKLVELEQTVEWLKARRRRDEKVLVLLWVMMIFSLSLSLYTFFRP